MSALTQQLNIYSSIGTENITSSSNNQDIYNEENVFQKGGFLNYLFSDTDKKVNKSRDTEMTEMLMRSMETGRFQTADFLMEYDFTPDFNVVNKENQHILYHLLFFRNKRKYANHAIITIIRNNKNTELLNIRDSKGRTPLFIAVLNGYNDIAEFMELNGAKRVSDKDDIRIVSEHPILTNNSQEIKDKQEQKEETKDNIFRPIFIKPKISGSDDSSKIDEIIKAFITTERQMSDTSFKNTSLAAVNENKLMDNILNSVKEVKQIENSNDIINSISEKLNRTFDSKKSDVNNMNTEEFISKIAKRIMDKNSPIKGGAKNKKIDSKKSDVNNMNTEEFITKNAKRIMNKNSPIEGGAKKKNIISGQRDMKGYSSDMNTVSSDGQMKKISRAISKQEKNFHNEAIKKILSHLNKKDKLVAKAIKTIIFNNVSEAHKELSKLDKASSMFKMINKKNIDSILAENKDLINKIKKTK